MKSQEVESEVIRQAQEVVIAKVKSDLQRMARGILLSTWIYVFRDTRMLLTSELNSPLLKREPCGHERIEIDLTADGKILERLVHYKTDGYDSEKGEPDEELGEATDERYLSHYEIAVHQLEWLKKQASPQG